MHKRRTIFHTAKWLVRVAVAARIFSGMVFTTFTHWWKTSTTIQPQQWTCNWPVLDRRLKPWSCGQESLIFDKHSPDVIKLETGRPLIFPLPWIIAKSEMLWKCKTVLLLPRARNRGPTGENEVQRSVHSRKAMTKMAGRPRPNRITIKVAEADLKHNGYLRVCINQRLLEFTWWLGVSQTSSNNPLTDQARSIKTNPTKIVPARSKVKPFLRKAKPHIGLDDLR